MHAAVCDFILDCIQNSIEAGASEIRLLIAEDENITVEIRDNGKGMTESELKNAVDPFYTNGQKHIGRRVGLGLPFLIQAVEQTGGKYSLESEKGKGTTLGFSFRADHVDTPPIGNISGMILQSLIFDGDYELIVERRMQTDGEIRGYHLKRSEIREILGDLNNADSLILARQFLSSQEDSLIEEETGNGKDDTGTA